MHIRPVRLIQRLALALLSATLLGGGAPSATSGPEPAPAPVVDQIVQVPSVLGLDGASAKSALIGQGFEVFVLPAGKGGEPGWIVSQQTPQPLTEACEGSTVHLVLERAGAWP